MTHLVPRSHARQKRRRREKPPRLRGRRPPPPHGAPHPRAGRVGAPPIPTDIGIVATKDSEPIGGMPAWLLGGGLLLLLFIGGGVWLNRRGPSPEGDKTGGGGEKGFIIEGGKPGEEGSDKMG